MEENTRRLKSCVEVWPDCAEGEYNPYCCRYPKSCSCTIVHNQAALDDPKWREENLEPVQDMRVSTVHLEMTPLMPILEGTQRHLTAGTGLSYGNQSNVSAGVRLSDEVLEEIQHLRMYYIDMEQVHSLRRWAEANPGQDPTPELLVKWRMDGMDEWVEDHPQLAVLLRGERTYFPSKEAAKAANERPAFRDWILDLTEDGRYFLKPSQ